MDFFGIGMGEVLLILIVALLVFGPRRLPEIGRTLGRMMHVLRKATYELTEGVTKEIDREKKDRSLQSEENISDQSKESANVSKARLPRRGD